MRYLLYFSFILLFIAGLGSGCSKDHTKQPSVTDTTTYNINSVTDVQFGQNTSYTGETETLLLDVYSPKNASSTTKYPLVVMAHGGSFLVGDKKNLATLCQSIAEKGFIAVSINYRLGWDYGNARSPVECKGDTVSLQKAFYRSMQDMNAAVRYMVHNANTYFIDTNWIFVGGSSAGAVAAVNTTYTTQEFVDTYFATEKTELGDLVTVDNNLTDRFTIKGNICMWGAIFSPKQITPATAVPMVAFHGSSDETVPININHYALCSDYPTLYGSQYIYNTLTDLGVPAVLHIAENEGHEPPMYQDPTFVSDNISCFLQGLISKSAEKGLFQNLTSSCP